MPSQLESLSAASERGTSRGDKRQGSSLGADEAIVRTIGLTKRYGTTVAVNELSFDVRAGEVFGFVGPNGSGKSTTIAMLLGLVTPTSGTVELFGLGHERRGESLTRVGAVIDASAYYPYLSGRRNLLALCRLHPGVPTQRVDEMLDLVDLRGAANRRAGQYSLGMKQRLAIAGALLHNPQLLILDEPTNGLDPAGILEVRHLITQLANLGTSIFMSSHMLSEVEQICDRVAIIDHGKIIMDGLVAELMSTHRQTRIRVDKPARAVDILRRLRGVTEVGVSDTRITLTLDGVAPADVNSLLVLAGIRVHELHAVTPTLEHVFLASTGSNEYSEA